MTGKVHTLAGETVGDAFAESSRAAAMREGD
jgi:hypothetical protein